MKLAGWQKTTLIDYPGKVAATIFTSGCNFRCPFCYSKELVLKEEIEKQPEISERDFFNFLEERKRLLEAVVICGGEPTIHKDLPDFLKKIKKFGYLSKLDTNGSNPEMLKKIIEEDLLDYIAMDVKAPLLNEKYDKAAGLKVDLKKIKESVDLIKNSGVDYEFRITVVPGLQTKEDIIQIAEEIGKARRFFLQNFDSTKPLLDPSLQKIKPYSHEYLLEIREEILPFFEKVGIR